MDGYNFSLLCYICVCENLVRALIEVANTSSVVPVGMFLTVIVGFSPGFALNQSTGDDPFLSSTDFGNSRSEMSWTRRTELRWTNADVKFKKSNKRNIIINELYVIQQI